MKNIKIPLLIKIYGFLVFVLTLLNFLFLDLVYAIHGIGKIFFIFLGVAILWLLYSFSIYKYIKKPSIWNGRLHIFVLILIILGNIYSIIGGFLNFGTFILMIPLVINIFLLNRFLKINKILKNKEKFSEEKFYSEKSQEKGLIKTFGVFVIGLIIFYFTYYIIPPVELKQIPDSYFDDSELYKNVDSEENINNFMKNINFQNFYDKISKEEYEGLKLNSGKDNKNKIQKINFKEEIVKEIDKDIVNFRKLKNKKYYIEKYSDFNEASYYLNNGYSKYGYYSFYLSTGQKIKY